VTDLAHYFVTDIETDGPSPLENSMLSFASVALREDGKILGEFEAVLIPRNDKKPDPDTIVFWQTQPEAWQAATTGARPPGQVMPQFVEWVETFPGPRAFAARPIMFDGIWMEHYLREFANCYLLDVPYWGRAVFNASPLDIGTYISGVFNRTQPHSGNIIIPDDWLGQQKHTHCAIDDARGYANLLARLLKIARDSPPHRDDFLA